MALSFKDIEQQKEFEFSFPHYVFSDIILIGCGGTGGYLVPDLLRAFRFKGTRWDRAPRILLIDGDIVERRNLQRQNFIEADLGHSKAQVMANRYGPAFNMDISYSDKFILSAQDLENLIGDLRAANSYDAVLIITCTDNNKTRAIVQEFWNKWYQQLLSGPKRDPYYSYRTRELVWLDSGNEDTYGQVCVSKMTPYSGSRYTRIIINNREEEVRAFLDLITTHTDISPSTIVTPTVCEIFPQILQDDTPADQRRSCAEVAEENPQNILINRIAASVALSYVYKLIYQEKLNHYMTSFNTRTSETKSYPITRSELIKVFSPIYQLDSIK